jgi:ActR/RegA family two-component response regulator
MSALSGERARVLIVDDQGNWREALCDMLDPSIYEIEDAATYSEAKRRLRECCFHVLVADQRLVDSDPDNIEGILLLDLVNELQDGTRAIIVTAYPTVETAKDALRGRHAFDYILKRPEAGGPFNIGQYRHQVKQAAEDAILARRKAITLDFSISALIPGMTYNQIAKMVLPEGSSLAVEEDVQKVLMRLLYSFQPLGRGMGKVWLPTSERTCEVLFWSRGGCQAALVRVGQQERSLDARPVDWLKEKWHLVERERFSSLLVSGVSYTVDQMTFDDFALQIAGG